VAGSGGLCCEDSTRCCAQCPREESQEWFSLVENGRLEPQGWNAIQRGFQRTHQ
jgi:hypothetical protein